MRALSRLRRLLPVLVRLGPANVAMVAGYRVAVRSGLAAQLTPPGTPWNADLFDPMALVPAAPPGLTDRDTAPARAEELAQGRLRCFSGSPRDVGHPPDWFLNPFSGRRVGGTGRHWSRIGDFLPDVGDIKAIWETSRFDWVLVLVQACRLSGRTQPLEQLNAWIADWLHHNPANTGPNWKCGQETAIRLLQTLLAARLLGQDEHPTAALVRFVGEHCARIAATLAYAVAQNNNHATSEAAALYIAGAWLARRDPAHGDWARRGRRWHRIGARQLDERTVTLVEPDGSFSQYSVTYHRVLLDTLCLAETWRRWLGLPAWSGQTRARARAATLWLWRLTDPRSGDGPNLGANDGTRLFALTGSGYRDFRPTVQWASTLFLDGPVLPPGPWDDQLRWLDLPGPTGGKPLVPPPSMLFPDGGYAVLDGRDGRSWACVRFPRFRFRPGHADALHLDLWVDGKNLLRDGGTFSYAAPAPWGNYFPGTISHNTVQFDGRDQMPRLGRFLFGDWLAAETVEPVTVTAEGVIWAASYRDRHGCHHQRRVSARDGVWRVEDEIAGQIAEAVLRWRLAPGEWTLSGLTCSSRRATLTIEADGPVGRCDLVEGWESRHYMERTPLLVLEIAIGPTVRRLTTTIQLS